MNKKNMKSNKINWRIRLKNPVFIVQIGMSIAMPISIYYGLSASDVTTWSVVFKTIGNAISNPFVIGTVIFSVYNTIKDPTTKGFGDSERALEYKVFKKNERY